VNAPPAGRRDRGTGKRGKTRAESGNRRRRAFRAHLGRSRRARAESRRRRRGGKRHPVRYAERSRGRFPGHSAAYENGYRHGLYDGGERLLEQLLPGDAIIPGITLGEVLEAGVEAVRHRAVPVMGPAQVHAELEAALRERRPFSLVRLGDGELLVLAQDLVMPAKEVKRAGPFLPNAGVRVPDLRARDEVAETMKRASIVGVPLSRKPHFQPLLFAVWQAHGMDPRSLRLTTSTINFALYEQGWLFPMLAGWRVLLVGNTAGMLSRRMTECGVTVVGAVHPVRGFDDIPRVLAEAAAVDFDIALVSAGIPAVPICVRLSEITGKVSLDFGHLADMLAGLKTCP